MIYVTYQNHLGQILKSDASFYIQKLDKEPRQAFLDAHEAKEAAELFVKTNPLYHCQILYPDGKEEIVGAISEEHEAARNKWQLEMTELAEKNISFLDRVGTACSRYIHLLFVKK